MPRSRTRNCASASTRSWPDRPVGAPARAALATSRSTTRSWRSSCRSSPKGSRGAVGEPQAAVMATSYLLAGVEASARPVCFAFNGGPGSASIWLHLGALGPKRVVTPDDGSMPRAPYAVADNPHSWFPHFDLVFIDPPHTGWSVCASAEARKKMLSVDGDVACPDRGRCASLAVAPPALDARPILRGRRELRHDARRRDRRQAGRVQGIALAGLILDLVRDGPAVAWCSRRANDLPYTLYPAGVRGGRRNITACLKGHAVAKSAAGARVRWRTEFVDVGLPVACCIAGARVRRQATNGQHRPPSASRS